MAQLLKGAEVVSALNDSIRAEVSALVSRGVVPTLAILRVGEKPDDLAYEQGAVKRAGDGRHRDQANHVAGDGFAGGAACSAVD